jgi:16S rRNA (adenine1518-N6/adenine1519-N6)-dimethyltransferase
VNASAIAAFRQLGLLPKKSFGQNFLVDGNTARRIAELAAPGEGATLVEIGAGLGALTEPLLLRGARVAAIERDRDLCPLLRQAFGAWIEQGRLILLEEDAKQTDLGGLSPRVLTGNLPYQLTGPLLERTIHLADLTDRVVFMVQAEVAERLIARPGSSAYGALTVFVSAAFEVVRAFTVGAGTFFPRPAVDSAVIVLTPLRPARAEETESFRAVVRAAFGQRRKTLRNALRGLGTPAELSAWAETAGIDLGRRGETLAVEEFARLAELSQGARPRE